VCVTAKQTCILQFMKTTPTSMRNVEVSAFFKNYILFLFRTLFGREFEATAWTKLDTHKVEQSHNHFMLVTKEGHPITVSASVKNE